MKLREVPTDMIPVQCQLCGDFLAARQGMTGAETSEMIVDHLTLCPASDRPTPGKEDR